MTYRKELEQLAEQLRAAGAIVEFSYDADGWIETVTTTGLGFRGNALDCIGFAERARKVLAERRAAGL